MFEYSFEFTSTCKPPTRETGSVFLIYKRNKFIEFNKKCFTFVKELGGKGEMGNIYAQGVLKFEL